MKDNVEIAVTAARLLAMLLLARDHNAARRQPAARGLLQLVSANQVVIPIRKSKQRGLVSCRKAGKYLYLKGNEPGAGIGA